MVTRMEYAILARAAYSENTDDIPPNWEILKSRENESGFAATAYENKVTHEVVIAYRGTDSGWENINDWTQNNLSLALNKVPDQFTDAIVFYNEIVSISKNKEVSITGHSLGGILAQLVGANTLKETVTFNTIGVAHLLKRLRIPLSPDLNYSNITNYSLENDILFILNDKMNYKLLGNVYVIPSTNTDPITAHNSLVSAGNDECYLLTGYERYKQQGIPSKIDDMFTEAMKTAPIRRDPLLVDLDGDGIETTTVENGVFFDHQNDGFAETSAWVGQDDGILAFAA